MERELTNEEMLAEIEEMEKSTGSFEKSFFKTLEKQETTSIKQAMIALQTGAEPRRVTSSLSASEIHLLDNVKHTENKEFIGYLQHVVRKAFQSGLFQGVVEKPEELGLSFELVYDEERYWLKKVLVWDGEIKTPDSFDLEVEQLPEFFYDYFSPEALVEYLAKDKIYQIQ